MINDRCPVCGRKKTRTTEQNRFYWTLLHNISEHVKPQGNEYTAEQWHLYFKGKFIGVEDIVLPNKKVFHQPISTTSLSVDEMVDYVTKIEAFASEHGVSYEKE
jgi:hypothetical protein